MSILKKKFVCEECGKIHSGWPALAFSSPVYYYQLSDKDKTEIAKIGSDFCVIEHENQTDRFIRCTLIQKVVNSNENLDYGIWVSVSNNSYEDYYNNFDNPNHINQYFGWISNLIPEYEDTTKIPVTIITQKGNDRPLVFPNEDFQHKFVDDFVKGIRSHEAQRRVDNMMGE